jgi:hypothetical protein
MRRSAIHGIDVVGTDEAGANHTPPDALRDRH